MFYNNQDNDLWKTVSTGNRLKDLGIGTLFGLADSINNPGEYYVRANYKGDGLADTGIGYISNNKYRDPMKLYEPLMAQLNSRRMGESIEGNEINPKSSLAPILGRLSKLQGNLGNWSANLLGRLNKNSYGTRGSFDVTGFENLM